MSALEEAYNRADGVRTSQNSFNIPTCISTSDGRTAATSRHRLPSIPSSGSSSRTWTGTMRRWPSWARVGGRTDYQLSVLTTCVCLCVADTDDQTHLYMRSKDVEANVDELDKHDSFYHTTKSLLVLFQIMGVMPIMRSPKGNEHWKPKVVNLDLSTYTII